MRECLWLVLVALWKCALAADDRGNDVDQTRSLGEQASIITLKTDYPHSRLPGIARMPRPKGCSNSESAGREVERDREM